MPSAKENVRVLYIRIANKSKRFYIQKSRQFAKIKTIPVTLLCTESKTIYISRLFMKMLKLAFIYKKHDTFRYVNFLYKKIQTLRKKQENVRYVFILKNPEHLTSYDSLLKFGNCRRGGSYMKKTIHCELHFYMQKKMHFALHFYIQKG